MPSFYAKARLHESMPPLVPELDEALWKYHGIPAKTGREGAIMKLKERIVEDPELLIFGGFVRTFDEHATGRNRVKPFPTAETYLRKCLAFIHRVSDNPTRAILKSRQLMLTWLVCAYAVWEAHFHEYSRVMIQSRKAEDAWKLVYKQAWEHSRCGFIERAFPPELWAVGAIGTKGEIAYPWGSEIWGIPQGPHMFRSYTATLAICDEAAFQPEFKEAYTAMLPMAKKIVIVSTALGGSFFGDIIEQNPVVEMV